MSCSNCSQPIDKHCTIHAIPCCPGKCPGSSTDQLAAEAWQKIQYYYTPDMTGHTGRTGEAIIKSAIEKAYHEGYSAHEKDYPRFTAWLESRAAHASEHPHANWCQSLPPFNANCNCGAAHASEVTKEKE